MFYSFCVDWQLLLFQNDITNSWGDAKMNGPPQHNVEMQFTPQTLSLKLPPAHQHQPNPAVLEQGVNSLMLTHGNHALLSRGVTPPSRPDSTCASSPSPYAPPNRPVSRTLSPIHALGVSRSINHGQNSNCPSPALPQRTANTPQNMAALNLNVNQQLHPSGLHSQGNFPLKIEIPNSNAVSCQSVSTFISRPLPSL